MWDVSRVWAASLVGLLASCTFGSDVDGDGGGDGDGETSDAGTTVGTPVTGSGGTPSTSTDATTGDTTVALDAGETESSGTTDPSATSTTTDGATDSTTDSTTDTGTSTDTGEPFPSGPFGKPTRIDELSELFADDDDPTVRSDGLEIYFNSNRSGLGEIWGSTRSDPDDPWDAPQIVTSLSSVGDDTTPQLSEDGLVMVLSSNRPPSAFHDLWVSTRDDLGAAWSDPDRFTAASGPGEDWGGLLIGTDLLVCTDRAGGVGLLDIWQFPVDIAELSTGIPVNVGDLNTIADECTLSPSVNGLEVFWEHLEDGGDDWDLWTATRTDPGDPWEDPTVAPVLSTDSGERDPWLVPSGDRLYFASDREGQWDLFVAER